MAAEEDVTESDHAGQLLKGMDSLPLQSHFRALRQVVGNLFAIGLGLVPFTALAVSAGEDPPAGGRPG